MRVVSCHLWRRNDNGADNQWTNGGDWVEIRIQAKTKKQATRGIYVYAFEWNTSIIQDAEHRKTFIIWHNVQNELTEPHYKFSG